MIDLETRYLVEDLYARYASCLNNERLDEWPEFFVDDCQYVVIPRENFEHEWPLATMSLESKGMLKDRIYGIKQTLFFAPYYQRHMISALSARSVGDDIEAEANYLVIRTKRNELSEIYNCGRYMDRIVRTPEGLKFAVKRCIFDSEMIPNSLIYPL